MTKPKRAAAKRVPIPVATAKPQRVPQQPDGSFVIKVKGPLDNSTALPKKRRRRRRSRSQVLAQRVLVDIRHKQRDFLKQASAMLSDALGFEVRVALVRVKPDLSPAMRKASRMTRKQARRQMAESMQAPIAPSRTMGLDDAIPF